MVGRPKNTETELGPDDEPAHAAYERDFYSWSMEQARHLRDRRYGVLDHDNLAEEIESLGREQFNKLVSALRVLMVHFLKWDHQPPLRSRSWVLSIEEQRLEIADGLADNPGLKPRIAEAIARAYRRARIEAAKETGLDEAEFPRLVLIRSTISARADFHANPFLRHSGARALARESGIHSHSRRGYGFRAPRLRSAPE